MDENVFPNLVDVKPTETIHEVDLYEFGVPMIARIKRSSNFSDYLPDGVTDEQVKKLARHYSQIFKAKVSEKTVRLAQKLAQNWDGPNKPNGHQPNDDDMIKLSIVNADAFTELVGALSAANVEPTQQEAEKVAVTNFTDGQSSGSELSKPASRS